MEKIECIKDKYGFMIPINKIEQFARGWVVVGGKTYVMDNFYYKILLERFEEVGRVKSEPEPQQEQGGIFVTNIRDINFSTRTMNILLANDIETIADLKKLHKTDILKFRNGGKAMISELDNFFKKYNIEWVKL